jgi:small-conductance mechanosensitive channel
VGDSETDDGEEGAMLELPALQFLRDYPLLAISLAAVLAVMGGVLAQGIGHRALQRALSRYSVAGVLLGYTARPLRALIPLLLLQLVWLGAPPQWEWMGQVRHITGLLFIAAATWLAIRCIAGLAKAIVQRRPMTVADNLDARRLHTQTQVIARSLMFFALLIGLAMMLMTFPGIRAVGTSLLASAGLAGIVAGIAARPVLSNLIAGLQIALSQPIRLDDVLIVEGEWGRVEEISGSYVVLRLWDQRRLVVPLQWFVEHPFQNWTRTSAQIIGTVFWWVDYRMPLAPLRAELERICLAAVEWDGRLSLLQVTDAGDRAIQLRALVSSSNADQNWDLRCKVREALVAFMQAHYDAYLPRQRAELSEPPRRTDADASPPASYF